MTHRPDIVPYFSYPDGKAAQDFLVQAFGFEVVHPFDDAAEAPAHAELRHGDGVILLRTGDAGPGSPGVYLVVADVDAHFAHAKAAGAEIVYPPRDTEFGARRYQARDLAGHEWSFWAHTP